MAKLPQSCGAATAVGALGLRDGGASGIKPRGQQSHQQHREQHREPGPGTPCRRWRGGEAASCAALCTAGRHGAGCATGQRAHRAEAGRGGGGGEGGSIGQGDLPGLWQGPALHCVHHQGLGCEEAGTDPAILGVAVRWSRARRGTRFPSRELLPMGQSQAAGRRPAWQVGQVGKCKPKGCQASHRLQQRAVSHA